MSSSSSKPLSSLLFFITVLVQGTIVLAQTGVLKFNSATIPAGGGGPITNLKWINKRYLLSSTGNVPFALVYSVSDAGTIEPNANQPRLYLGNDTTLSGIGGISYNFASGIAVATPLSGDSSPSYVFVSGTRFQDNNSTTTSNFAISSFLFNSTTTWAQFEYIATYNSSDNVSWPETWLEVDGEYLYALKHRKSGSSVDITDLEVFSLNDGLPSPVSKVTLSSGWLPASMAVARISCNSNSTTRVIYVASEDTSKLYAFVHTPASGSTADTVQLANTWSTSQYSDLAGVSGIAISPDQNHLYAVAHEGDSNNKGAIMIFSTSNCGSISLASSLKVNADGKTRWPRAVVVSESGNFVYVSSVEGKVLNYRRNTDTGGLTQLDATAGNVASEPSISSLAVVMDDPSAISNNYGHVAVAYKDSSYTLSLFEVTACTRNWLGPTCGVCGLSCVNETTPDASCSSCSSSAYPRSSSGDSQQETPANKTGGASRTTGVVVALTIIGILGCILLLVSIVITAIAVAIWVHKRRHQSNGSTAASSTDAPELSPSKAPASSSVASGGSSTAPSSKATDGNNSKSSGSSGSSGSSNNKNKNSGNSHVVVELPTTSTAVRVSPPSSYRSCPSRISVNVQSWVIQEQDIIDPVLVGQGNFGIVFKAKLHGEVVALKKLKMPQLQEDQVSLQRVMTEFENEVSLLATLRHPNILAFRGAIIKMPNVGIVTEFMDLGTLHELIHGSSKTNNSGRGSRVSKPKRANLLTWDQKIKILHDMALGLAYLHRMRVIHRDLKPMNILVTSGGPTDPMHKNYYLAKIADLGISKMKEFSTAGQDESRINTIQVGTPLWMAPEVTLGDKYGTASDVFSYGIMMSEMLTERMPYFDYEYRASANVRVATNPELRPTITENLRVRPPPELFSQEAEDKFIAIMKSCWQHDPDQRPQMSEVATQLEQMMDKQ